LTAAAVLAAAPGASAASTPKVPSVPKVPKVKIAKFKGTIDVSMTVHVRSTYESLADCKPGENAAVTYTYDYESGRGNKAPSNAQFEFVGGFGGTTSPSKGADGAATEDGKVTAYQVSADDCIASTTDTVPSDITPPTCTKLAGRVEANFALGAESDDDEDLAPLAPNDGTLLITRVGGGGQDLSCLRTVSITESADKLFEFKVGGSVATGSASATLQAFKFRLRNVKKDLTALKGKKGKFTRSFEIAGPCDGMHATKLVTGAAPFSHVGSVYGNVAEENCAVDGKGVIIFERRSKVKTA
jgi:hypothetical protein